MYTCIIVEDEPPVMRQLESCILATSSHLKIVAKAINLTEAIKATELHRPQIVFLDIQLGAESGFGLLEHFKEPFFETIVVTGYDQFAIEALRWSAADYLLKPVNNEQLGAALIRVFKRIGKGDTHRKAIANNLLEYWQWQMLNDYRQILLPVTGEQIVVTLSEILWLESHGSYTQFNFKTGTNLLISRGLFQYAPELEPFGFIRCHQGYLVNRRYIRKLIHTATNREVELTTGLSLPVSRQYYKNVKNKLQEVDRFFPEISFEEPKK